MAVSVEEIVAEMLALYWVRTGVEPSAVEGDIIRTLFEAVAYQVEQTHARFEESLKSAIPEAVFTAFGFERRRGERATLTLRFARGTPATEPIVIPAGTRARSASGLLFATQADAVIAIGTTYADAEARCETPGEAGNVPLGSVTNLVDALPGVESVVNITPGVGGVDEETVEDATQRFARYAAAMAKGTLGAIAAAALESGYGNLVRRVRVADCATDANIPVGEVHVYVDGYAALGSDELATIGAALNEVRPAGVRVVLAEAPRVPVNVSLRLEGGTDEDEAAATAAVGQYIYGLGIGEPLIRDRLVAHLVRALPTVGGINLLTPGSDVGVGTYDVLVPGNVTVFR